jgi:hypothetical protein
VAPRLPSRVAGGFFLRRRTGRNETKKAMKSKSKLIWAVLGIGLVFGIKKLMSKDDGISGINEKPLSWYKYETPRILVLWYGRPQPFGRFKSALEALRFIEEKMLPQYPNTLYQYSLQTPDGIIPLGNDAKNGSGGMGLRGSILSKDRAREIASHWHGGQWSALYQFMSSGVYMPQNHLWYLFEIIQDIENEYHAPYPRKLSQKETRELKSLIRWFAYKGEEHGIKTDVRTHSQYGYSYPVVSENRNNHSIDPLKILV